MKSKTPDYLSGPLSQDRYVKGPEFAELRGISGTAVAARVALLEDSKIRSLLLWIQAISLEPGKLKHLCQEILDRFADRIGTPSMLRIGNRPGQVYNAEEVKQVRQEMRCPGDFPLRGEYWHHDYECFQQVDCDANKHEIARAKTHPNSYPASMFLEGFGDIQEKLSAFLVDLCVNPRFEFHRKNEKTREQSEYESRLQEQFPQEGIQTKRPELYWFNDIVGALIEIKNAKEKEAREKFALTAIGRKVWASLDYALKAKGLLLIEGKEGRGKSEAVKAWVQFHLGEARFVSLRGITSKTTAFREIARPLGIPLGYNHKFSALQNRLEDVLRRSKLIMILDESHFILDGSQRVSRQPEILDWIDTMENDGVGFCLVSTPQFITRLTRAVDQTGYNFRQFERRKKYVKLPKNNTEGDIELVARSVLPGAPESAIVEAVACAKISDKDLSAIGQIVKRLKAETGVETLSKVTHAQVKRGSPMKSFKRMARFCRRDERSQTEDG